MLSIRKNFFESKFYFQNGKIVFFRYQISTVTCMHGSMVEACGKEAADLALGPAMDELMVPTAAPVPTSPTPTKISKNSTSDNGTDVYSRSRQFMDRRETNSAQMLKKMSFFWIILFIWTSLVRTDCS